MRILILSMMLIPASCASFKENSAEPNKLHFVSGLKHTVRLGKGNANYTMGSKDQQKGLYMLGPEEHFKGEITVFDGTIYNTKVSGEKFKTTHDPVNMVFNVFAECEKFYPREIKQASDLGELENALAEISDSPKVFKFKGKADFHRAHVVMGLDKKTQRPAKRFIEKSNVMMDGLGFFSKNHRRIFTHHDSDVHVHIIDQNRDTFHLDEVKNVVFDSFEVCELMD